MTHYNEIRSIDTYSGFSYAVIHGESQVEAAGCTLICDFLSFVRHSHVFIHSEYIMITNNPGEIKR